MAIIWLLSAVACIHKTVGPPVGASHPATDNSYMDLTPAWQLRILVPLLKTGTDRVIVQTGSQDGKTIVLSAANLEGYRLFYYSIVGKGAGKVQLKFASAQVSKDGHNEPEINVPQLPFSLPSSREYIRLIYLIRSSQSDHDMAITASNNLKVLNAFTERLRLNPKLCEDHRGISCVWVPPGIAVRPEPVGSEN